MAKQYYSRRVTGGISNSSAAPGNLPQNVIRNNAPEYPCGGKGGLDDTIYGIDEQIRGDISAYNKNPNGSKEY